jgi:hypothetical protein
MNQTNSRATLSRRLNSSERPEQSAPSSREERDQENQLFSTKLPKKKRGIDGTLCLELNPASHSLSELRQELIAVVNRGVFDHTIAAFWQVEKSSIA